MLCYVIHSFSKYLWIISIPGARHLMRYSDTKISVYATLWIHFKQIIPESIKCFYNWLKKEGKGRVIKTSRKFQWLGLPLSLPWPGFSSWSGNEVSASCVQGGRGFHRHENILRVRQQRDWCHQYFLNAKKVISADLTNTMPKFVSI